MSFDSYKRLELVAVLQLNEKGLTSFEYLGREPLTFFKTADLMSPHFANTLLNGTYTLAETKTNSKCNSIDTTVRAVSLGLNINKSHINV